MRARSLFALGALTALSACRAAGPAPSEDGAAEVTAASPARVASRSASASTSARIDELSRRFRHAAPVLPQGHPARPRPVAPVIGKGVAESFVSSDASHLLVVADHARTIAPKAARIELPKKAWGPLRLEDETSRVAVEVSLEGASDAELATADGIAVYSGALGGADVIHRPSAEGTEDFVVFEERPAREELVYRVDMRKVAGLRLVESALEMLDEGGAPRLRVAPPWVVDEGGETHEAKLSVSGCAYDSDPRGPWGRAVTAPGAATCRVTVTWSGVDYPAIVDPSWAATGNMTSPREEHGSALLANGKVLAGAGYGAGSAALATAELYDPSTGTWAATGSLANARGLPGVATLASGKVLFVGGISSGSTTAVEAYDPTTGTWGAAGNLSVARFGHSTTLLSSGKVLAAGGFGQSGSDLYNPATNSWTAGPALTSVRAYHTATPIAGAKVVLAAGYVFQGMGITVLQTSELYNEATNAFTAGPNLVTARYFHAAASLPNGKVLVAGGNNASFVAQTAAELYDPTANAWTATAAMTVARGGFPLVPLPSGDVLAPGGYVTSGGIASVDLYDVGLGTWSAVPNMLTPRGYFTAQLLADDKSVLVAGGDNASGTQIAGAELYKLTVKGAACTRPSECSTGFCVDGVCCNTACGGGVTNDCQACSVATGAAVDGTCGAVVAGKVCRAATDACDLAEKCDGTQLTCPADVKVVCTAMDTCHKAGTCSGGTCSNPTRADGFACDDNNLCTQTDSCQNGACTGSSPVVCTAMDECHQVGSCTPATGICSNPAKPDGADCTGGSCVGGVCHPASTSATSSSASASSGATGSGGGGATSSSAGTGGGAASSGGTGGGSSSSSSNGGAGGEGPAGSGGSGHAASSGQGGAGATGSGGSQPSSGSTNFYGCSASPAPAQGARALGAALGLVLLAARRRRSTRLSA